LEHIAIGGSIEQTFWTQHPESAGITPEAGMEYQINLIVTRTSAVTHTVQAHVLATRIAEQTHSRGTKKSA